MSALLLRTICGARASFFLPPRTAPLSSSPKTPKTLKTPKDRSSKPEETTNRHAADEQLALEHEQARAAAEDATFGQEEFEEPEMKATAKEMAEARLPLRYRDYCAHMLIPLNKCRHRSMYLPWKCVEERHAYEKCEYEDFMRRSKMLAQIKDNQ